MKRPFTLLLFTFFALAMLPGASAWAGAIEHMRFQRLLTGEGADKGHSVGPVKAIAQDALGFIWIGGQEGVVRFDSLNYKFYRADGNNGLPDNFVYDILVDRDGVMWLATGSGLARYDSYNDRFVHVGKTSQRGLCGTVAKSLAIDSANNLYIGTDQCLAMLNADRRVFARFYPHGQVPAGYERNDIRSVAVDTEDRVWLGTYGGGLSLLDPKTGAFDHWQHKDGVSDSLASNDVETLMVDSLSRVWVGTYSGGLSRMNPDGRTFTNFKAIFQDPTSLGSNAIRDLLEDRTGRIWIATDHAGLTLFQPETATFRHFRNNAYDPTSLNSDQVRKLFEDNQGDLWIGAFPGGVNFYDVSKSSFRIWQHQPGNKNSLSNNGILHILQGSDKRIWIGTEQGLNVYDKSTQTFTRFFRDPNDPQSLRSNVVVSMAEGDDGHLWLGTWSGGLHYFHPEHGVVRHYMPRHGDSRSLSSAHVWNLKMDGAGNLWIATIEGEGLSRYRSASDDFDRFSHNPTNQHSISHNDVSTLFVDSTQTLWVGTNGGLDRFDALTDRFTRLRFDSRGDHVRSIMEDQLGQLWVGTEHNGIRIIDRTNGHQIAQITQEHGLPSPSVTGLLQDAESNVWATTHNGLARISPHSLEITAFDKSNGLAGNNSNRNALLYDDEHTLLVGSTEGITLLKPSELDQNTAPPPVLITNLRVMNKPVAANEDSFLPQSIVHTEHLELPYPTLIFSFDFAALSYRSAHKNRFAYRLLGFDHDWNEVDNQASVVYTNIDPGKYVFQLRGANSYGVWNPKHAQINIDIPPPLWQTAWAYGFYVFATVTAVYVYVLRKTRRLRIEQERDQALANELLKLDKLKNAFLANTSHELRTPLNGIMGMAQTMIDSTSVTSPSRQRLQTIIQSAQKLDILVNDILDFSRLSSHQLDIKKRFFNLTELIEKIIAQLRSEAESKGLKLIFKRTEVIGMLGDDDKMHRIFFHILNNAIKYTDDGSITITTSLDNKKCRIIFQDTGIGIAAENLNNIFDAFNQLDFSDDRAHQGTGLGLALTQRLVELHGGSIEAQSEENVGSTFRITLPDCQSLFSITTDSLDDDGLNLLSPDHTTILIVDDEPVNLMVLSGMLQREHHQVMEATSGYEALEVLARDARIDLVILDIMMPKLSGLDTCRVIRQKYGFTDLPVILLSAKSKHEVVSQGQEVGANGYLCKPVNKEELASVIKECLNQSSRSKRRI